MAETPLGISTSYFANAGASFRYFTFLCLLKLISVYNDTAWDPSTLDFADYQKAVEVNAGNMNLFDPNITAFAGRGGKMLHYVGWGDQLISAGNSIRYADAVTAFTLANTDMDPSSFYKLYTVPGMGHCCARIEFSIPCHFAADR